jgi:cation:H+ antiporter
LEDLQIKQTDDNSQPLHSVRDSLIAGKKELGLITALIFIYLYLRFFVADLLLVLIVGFIVGIWLAFRPSEWAVEGIESAAGHLGYTAYIAGMMSSLASNMPEAVISGIAAYTGWITERQELLDIAVLSILVAAGFNMLLLGVTIIISTKGGPEMAVPEEAIKKDSVLIRWTIVALISMFSLGVLDLASPSPPIDPKFPAVASFVLFLSYIIYSWELAKGKVTNDVNKSIPSHSKRSALTLSLLGFVGIFFAGEILTNSVEIFLENFSSPISALGINHVTIAAFILGAAGALPEHGIALIAASKGKVGLAVGNLIGGVLQIVLLVMGGIGMFVLIPLDRYVLFQIIVIAGSLWFLKRAITDDHKLDLFEGAMIVLLQVYVFILLIAGTPI